MAKESKSKKEAAKQETKEKIEFPLEAKINRYGFLHFPRDLLAHLGFTAPLEDNVPVQITETTEGMLLLKVQKA
jgi:hypothetical protein